MSTIWGSVFSQTHEKTSIEVDTRQFHQLSSRQPIGVSARCEPEDVDDAKGTKS